MNTDSRTSILVWDWPVRVFHWCLAIVFVAAYVLGDSERWRDVHVALGYGAFVLIAFRIAWGTFGSTPARFASFIRSPRAAGRYLLEAVRGRPAAHTGHNPAGGWAILGMLLLGIGTAVSGWMRYQDLGGEMVEELHEVLAQAWLALVAVHVVAVAASSVLHRENLVRAMLTGRKRGVPAEGARRGHGPVAIALLAGLLLVIALNLRPAGGAPGATRPASVESAARNDED